MPELGAMAGGRSESAPRTCLRAGSRKHPLGWPPLAALRKARCRKMGNKLNKQVLENLDEIMSCKITTCLSRHGLLTIHSVLLEPYPFSPNTSLQMADYPSCPHWISSIDTWWWASRRDDIVAAIQFHASFDGNSLCAGGLRYFQDGREVEKPAFDRPLWLEVGETPGSTR
jgi:hypothetical protein